VDLFFLFRKPEESGPRTGLLKLLLMRSLAKIEKGKTGKGGTWEGYLF